MSIDAIAHIGRFAPPALDRSAALAPGRTILVRPVTPIERASSVAPSVRGREPSATGRDTPTADPSRRETQPSTPIVGTAYQQNSDGDSAAFSSRLNAMSPQERARLDKLRSRDQEVRQHEQAHVAAAGPLHRGGPNYQYMTGPDGNKYAVAGDVQIDTSPGRTPAETIAKAQQIRRAALAPSKPSSQDQSVAAKAAQMEADARRELAQSRQSSSKSVQPLEGRAQADAASAIDVYA